MFVSSCITVVEVVSGLYFCLVWPIFSFFCGQSNTVEQQQQAAASSSTAATAG